MFLGVFAWRMGSKTSPSLHYGRASSYCGCTVPLRVGLLSRGELKQRWTQTGHIVRIQGLHINTSLQYRPCQKEYRLGRHFNRLVTRKGQYQGSRKKNWASEGLCRQAIRSMSPATGHKRALDAAPPSHRILPDTPTKGSLRGRHRARRGRLRSPSKVDSEVYKG